MIARQRVLIAAQPIHFSDQLDDGFVIRHRSFYAMLSSHHDLGFLVMRHPDDPTLLSAALTDQVVGQVEVPTLLNTRAARAQQAAALVRAAPYKDWERALVDAARTAQPDCILTLGPWMDSDYRALRDQFRTIHLFEEDVLRMPELSSQSRQGRLFRRLEDAARSRLKGKPESVVVIADKERRPASRRFPGVDIVTLPYTLPSVDWPAASQPTDGDYVLVLGVLVQERNSEGLVDLLTELEARGVDRLHFRLVCDAGVHPDLLRFLELPWVEHLPAGDAVAEHYRGAKLALVPAKRATGMKTTILQAWGSGTAVVTYSASAATMGPANAGAVAAGEDASAVADRLLELWDDEPARHALARRGMERAREAFDETTVHAQLLQLIERRP